MIDINTLITENTNLIEIYICNKQSFDNKKINIELNVDFLNKIKQTFKITREIKYISYYRNNLNYIYDTSNDNQLLITRNLEKDNYENYNKIDLYYLILKENKLPNYYFACTNNLDNKETLNTIEFKINNRITLIIRNNNCFIQYKYNNSVETDKISLILKNIVKKLNSLV